MEVCSDYETDDELTVVQISSREPQWSDDELLCARSVNNEVHFYENRDFSKFFQFLFPFI